MKRVFVMILAAAFLLAAPLSGPAMADKVDFAKVTCGEFVELEVDELAMMYFWLDGYVSAKTDNTVMDTDGVEGDMTALVEACGANTESTVLNVIGH